MIYVNNSNIKIFRKHIPRLTYRSKICKIWNLHIAISLKLVENDFKHVYCVLHIVEYKFYG